jgi:serine/threonine protein kinase
MENNEDDFFEEETTKKDYQKIEKLGSGAYGTVYKALMKKNQKIVAVKRIKINLDTEGIPSSALREISILRNLHHENIEKILDIITTDTKLYMVLEFIEFDLQSFFEKLSQEPKITNYSHEELIKIILKQILKGVEYLHSKKIIHRDLKPQNVLINKDLTIKLADFGLSRKLSFEKRPYTQEVLSLWYRAPELLLGSNIYNEAIDIWSIGCIFGFLILKNTLFEGENEIDQLNKIMKFLGTPNFSQIPYYYNFNLNNYQFMYYPQSDFSEKFNNFDENGIDLLKKMLNYDPELRISCKEALAHPYFINKNENNNNLEDNDNSL